MTEILELLRAGLSDRFEIVREIGRGGMAIVYLAHDRRHDRKVALKVLRPELQSSVSAERFLREIRFAAQLQHPHILPLHDSGIVDQAVYYVMPFVEGESLRDQLRRSGRLPIADAVAIALQVADALAFAHERGVVHRDIKPENILLTVRGSAGATPFALVADFGIARALSEREGETLTVTGLVIGTPAYMSPEQAVGDRSVDARSDVYSLGCVLYEMLCGHPPFAGDTTRGLIAEQVLQTPPAVSESRKGVPASLEAIVRTAMAKHPGDRYVSAVAMSTALRSAADDITASLQRERKPARVGTKARRTIAVGGIVLLAALTMTVVDGWPSGIRFTEQDWIVVADVDNQTGDSVFDRSLTSALMTTIQQSKHVNVVPRSRVREVLQHMERTDTSTLDEATAREVAQRIGSPVVLATEITRVDSIFQLAARLVDPATGQPLKTEGERAEGRANVLTALDKLVGRVRRALNEPSFAIRASAPLPAATTSSLEALKRYADGSVEWSQGRYARAHQLYAQALEHDSQFVQAQVALGGAFYYENRRPDGERWFVKAEQRLPRLTEREQLLLGARIAGWRGLKEQQVSLLNTYLARWPRDEITWYNLGTAHFQSGHCQEALPAFRKALELDSLHIASRINSAMCLGRLRQPLEAVGMFRTAMAISPGIVTSGNLNHEFGNLLQEAGELDEARRIFGLMLTDKPDERARGLRSMALFEMVSGKFDSSAKLLREAIVQNRIQVSPVSEYRNRLFLSVALQHLGRPEGSRAQLDTAYRLFRRTYLEPWLLAYGGRLFIREGDVRRGRELRDSLAARMTTGNRADLTALELLDAELARAARRPESAADALEIAFGRDQANSYVLESLAEALADKGDLDGARARYEQLLEMRSLGWEGQEGGLLASFRLGQIAEAKSDTASALRWYARFLDQWKGGDSTIVEVVHARRRVAALGGPG
jgi:serine/threonine-protein kinase